MTGEKDEKPKRKRSPTPKSADRTSSDDSSSVCECCSNASTCHRLPERKKPRLNMLRCCDCSCPICTPSTSNPIRFSANIGERSVAENNGDGKQIGGPIEEDKELRRIEPKKFAHRGTSPKDKHESSSSDSDSVHNDACFDGMSDQSTSQESSESTESTRSCGSSQSSLD